MKISFFNIIGIDIDVNYKWKDSLFIDSYNYSTIKEDYKKCKQFIKIKYKKNINYTDSRKIENNIYACEKYIYDKEKKVKIYFNEEDVCVIESNQECNEWLIIMLQILLLKEGYSFIHAAAVSNDKNECLLIPSWGGVGKTASIAKLVQNGYKLLGDDINIISHQGEIIGFPKKFVLYFYHKELFPEVFEKKSIKCNSTLNKIYTNIIPTVKKILRYMPGALSFARKHNPQSNKISPYEIFGKDKIAKKANIKQIIWLERQKDKNLYNKIEDTEIISKAISITLHELFTDNFEAILTMCGMNILDYDLIFNKMYNIYSSAFNKKLNYKLNVNNQLHVSKVADEILKKISI